MAQFVGFFQDNVEYREGPFVACGSAFSPHYRVECEKKNHICPVLPHPSIYPILEKFKRPCGNREAVGCICDYLNKMVKDGEIVLEGDYWVHKDS